MILKNLILVVLIILILHFLIKNAMVDRATPATVKNVGAPEVMTTIPTVAVANTKEPFTATVAERNTDQEKKELLKYVFGEGCDSDAALSQYFTKLNAPPTTVQCPVARKDDKILPLTTTCDPNLLKLSLDQAPSAPKCGKPPATNDIDYMVLKEYDNENGMNGGQFGSLNPFDTMANAYEAYAPCGAK